MGHAFWNLLGVWEPWGDSREPDKKEGSYHQCKQMEDLFQNLGRKACPLWGSEQWENVQSDRGGKCSPAASTLMREGPSSLEVPGLM